MTKARFRDGGKRILHKSEMRKRARKRHFCEYCGSAQERLYTIETAANYLNCSKHTIRNWIRDRQIKFLKIKGLIRIPASSIEEEVQCFPKMNTIVDDILKSNS